MKADIFGYFLLFSNKNNFKILSEPFAIVNIVEKKDLKQARNKQK